MDYFSLAALWEQYRPVAFLLLGRLGTSLVLLLVFWLAALAVQRLVTRLCQARAISPDLVLFLSRTAKLAFLAFGVVTALGTLGVDVTALVAGLGLVGFALGFALKDMISNALAGILILLYKPFHRGDHISMEAHEGVVVEINLRYTVLTTEEARILIPNANLFTTVVKVSNRSTAMTPSGPPI